MKKWPATEVELAAPVVEWLRNFKWDVYQEVNAYGRTADIVAVQGRLLWVLEAKVSMSLAVMEQALFWRTWAHHVSVIVPHRRRGEHAYAVRCLRRDGTGVLEVSDPARYPYAGFQNVSEALAPALNRRIVPGLRDKLVEAQKTHTPAGSVNGSWTPFLGTCLELQRFVKANPGATLKQAIEGIKTHYRTPATARSSLAKWIQAGVVKGVRCELDGKALRLYAVDSSVDSAATLPLH